MTKQPLPAAPATAGFPFKRFVKDAGVMLAVIVVAALTITFITGELNRLYEQFVFSMCIGSIAFLIIDGVRLTLGVERHVGRKRWLPLLGVVLAATPISNYAGRALATLILGLPLPTMESFTTARSASMMMFTLLVIGGAVLLRINREHVARVEAAAAHEKARAEAVERRALQAQLALLQAQLEPHMLFNTLANLQGLIAIDPDRASHMLDQLIQYLRATLAASRSETTTLEQEFALIDAYLGLMSVRMGERLSYRLELPDSLRDARVPPMLLQPLVENAIIHGLEPKIAGGEVVIGAAQRGDLIDMTVSDNGLGLAGVPSKAGTGVGVSNTRERLRALYGDRASLAIEPAAQHGAVARLTLPLDLP